MALPFQVSCERVNPWFYEVGSGRFEQVHGSDIPPFIPGFQFLLVVNELADFLRTLSLEGVRFEDAVLYDPRTGAEARTHTCLRVPGSLGGGDIRNLSDGYRMVATDDQHYFVSPALKEALMANGFEYLRFSEGFSDFCGAA